MDSIRPSNPSHFNRPEIGAISATSFARQFVENFARLNDSQPQKLDLTELGANHYSDYKRTLEKYIDSPFLLSFINLFEEIKGVNPEKKPQLDVIDEVIYQRLCEAESENAPTITIEATRNGRQTDITLHDFKNGQIDIDFGDGKKITVEGLDFKKIKEVLAGHIANTLKDRVESFSDPRHRLAWVDIVRADNLSAALSYQEFEQLGSSNYLSTSYANSSNERIYRSTDVGTLVRDESSVAVTVIDGEHEEVDGRVIDITQLPIYSAAITTAAKHTVERGVLVHGLEGNTLKTFFIDKVKLLLNAHNIAVTPEKWPAFKGVILYEHGHPEIKHSKFEYAAEGGEPGVSVRVSNLNSSEIIHLTATKHAKAHGALHVDIKAEQAIFIKDDFDIVDREAVIYHNHKAREEDYSPGTLNPEGYSKSACQKEYKIRWKSKLREHALKIDELAKQVGREFLNPAQEGQKPLNPGLHINSGKEKIQRLRKEIRALKYEIEWLGDPDAWIRDIRKKEEYKAQQIKKEKAEAQLRVTNELAADLARTLLKEEQ